MRWLRVVGIAVAAGILQVSLMGALRLGAVVPGLSLVMVVCMTIWGSASEAILAAIIAGIIMDTVSGGYFGLATSSLVLIAIALVLARQRGIDGQTLPLRWALVLSATLAWGVIHVLAIDSGLLAQLATWRVIGIELLLNSLLAVVCIERIFRGTRTI